MTNSLKEIDLDVLFQTSKAAGDAILQVYARDFEVETKADSSPLTEADKASNAVIVEALKSQFPDIPIISEETKLTGYSIRKDWEWFWLIDPLDGTKEFIKKNGEFTVNIALVHRNTPVMGFVYRPVTKTLHYGIEGDGSYRIDGDGTQTKLSGGKHYSELDTIRVVASRSHLSAAVTDFVEKLKTDGKSVEFISAGSSLKLCLVAEGAADVYPRFGPTMEWDTAAAHAVAQYAGRKVLHHDTREPLSYNKENLLNPWFIVE